MLLCISSFYEHPKRISFLLVLILYVIWQRFKRQHQRPRSLTIFRFPYNQSTIFTCITGPVKPNTLVNQGDIVLIHRHHKIRRNVSLDMDICLPRLYSYTAMRTMGRNGKEKGHMVLVYLNDAMVMRDWVLFWQSDGTEMDAGCTINDSSDGFGCDAIGLWNGMETEYIIIIKRSLDSEG